MTLPSSASRLQALNGFVPWRKAVERLLAELDARIASSSSEAGTVVVWAGIGGLPAGLLLADGALLEREDYPALFDAIGTTYNIFGESAAQFRLPNFSTAPEHGVWAIRT